VKIFCPEKQQVCAAIKNKIRGDTGGAIPLLSLYAFMAWTGIT
jgi:hypothetical protein